MGNNTRRFRLKSPALFCGAFAALGSTTPAWTQSAPEPAATVEAAREGAAAEHPLSWHGITIYGSYDIGVGWVSHGLPENGYNYEGESLVNKNGAGSRFLIAQNNLSQTGLGIRGKEQLLPGWFAVFNAWTGINPQSGQLANMGETNTVNAGLPRASYSYAGDGARAGQAFNDELFAGISSDLYGTLTFGRQRALGTDAMLAYDPAGGAYSFSFIGYNGLMAGGGDTQDMRIPIEAGQGFRREAGHHSGLKPATVPT
jgi:predicted porin